MPRGRHALYCHLLRCPLLSFSWNFVTYRPTSTRQPSKEAIVRVLMGGLLSDCAKDDIRGIDSHLSVDLSLSKRVGEGYGKRTGKGVNATGYDHCACDCSGRDMPTDTQELPGADLPSEHEDLCIPAKPIHITFLQTGGTIDKDYPRAVGGYAFEIGPPAVNSILALPGGGLAFSYNIAPPVCLKDSSDITSEDRNALAEAISSALGRCIIVTHGTDTMTETAQILGSDPRVSGKVVVLTGASRPAKFSDSDAAFNVGGAVAVAGTLPTGVYVCMNGAVVEAKNIKRDMLTGKFYSDNSPSK
ncbi:unnamed protein product [Choristocarpus tenellus]